MQHQICSLFTYFHYFRLWPLQPQRARCMRVRILHDGRGELRHVVRAAGRPLRPATQHVQDWTHQYGLYEWYNTSFIIIVQLSSMRENIVIILN